MIQKLCDLCNSGRKKCLFSREEFKVVKCEDCGLVYVDPQPSHERINEYYTELNENTKTGAICQSEVEKKHCIKRLSKIKQYIKGGVILDYGCGISPFSNLAKREGFDCYGFDLDKEAIEICKKNGISMLAEEEIKKNHFDVITLSQVLEHIPYPKYKLEWLRTKLREGGMLLIEVPNINSLNSKLQGKNWFYYRIPYHLTYFSMKTLSRMLEEVGFKIIKKEWMGSFLLGMITQNMHKEGWTASDENKINLFYKKFDILVRLNYFLARVLRIGDHIRVTAQKVIKK